MGVLDFFKIKKTDVIISPVPTPEPEPVAETKPEKQASVYGGRLHHTYTHRYNGEKNLGEMGPVKVYALNYEVLRYRSWQAMLESEIAQIVINRFVTWVVGKGLSLQSEPNKMVLNSEGIKISDTQPFSKLVEARYEIWAKSSESDYSGMKNALLQEAPAYKNAIVGGDVLLLLRYENNNVNLQLIDGQHLGSPSGEDEYCSQALANGNYISNGIEKNAKGEHVAFYVRKPNTYFQFDRIPARGSESGMVMAKLIYGLEYRLDNDRGMPFISVVLETAKKMERYKEATLGSAEERQKIAYTIEHELGSTGDDPRSDSVVSRAIARANGVSPDDDIPETIDGEILANRIGVSMNKTTFNMPINSTLKSLESKNELYFKDFYNVNMEFVCAALGIPPNVAMSKFDANFSASRAALKDWEHSLIVRRFEFSSQYNQTIYNFFLEIEILKNKIQALGYLVARNQGNNMILTAYRNARWVGANVPHIDPVKEVNAERLKLGPAGAHIPLTTAERSTEALNGGEFENNIEQFAQELNQVNELGIKVPVQEVAPQNQDSNSNNN